VIQVLGVAKRFLALDNTLVEALDEVSLTIMPGEFVCLVGPSGCGKTTLLNIMAGLHKPSQGQVLRHGHKINGSFGWAGYLSQADTLLPWRTVRANAEIGLELRKVPAAQRRERVAGLIARVGLAGFEDKYPSELSGLRPRGALPG
jgi:NitT/TauT family transport system ATP-binding protein